MKNSSNFFKKGLTAQDRGHSPHHHLTAPLSSLPTITQPARPSRPAGFLFALP